MDKMMSSCLKDTIEKRVRNRNSTTLKQASWTNLIQKTSTYKYYRLKFFVLLYILRYYIEFVSFEADFQPIREMLVFFTGWLLCPINI